MFTEEDAKKTLKKKISTNIIACLGVERWDYTPVALADIKREVELYDN